MPEYEGKTLLEWTEEYLNASKELETYNEELKDKTDLSVYDQNKYMILMSGQTAIKNIAQSRILDIMDKELYDVEEFSKALSLITLYRDRIFEEDRD